jgi:hypothetical protein
VIGSLAAPPPAMFRDSTRESIKCESRAPVPRRSRSRRGWMMMIRHLQRGFRLFSATRCSFGGDGGEQQRQHLFSVGGGGGGMVDTAGCDLCNAAATGAINGC